MDENYELQLSLAGKHGDKQFNDLVASWHGLDYAQYTRLQNGLVKAMTEYLEGLGELSIKQKMQQGPQR